MKSDEQYEKIVALLEKATEEMAWMKEMLLKQNEAIKTAAKVLSAYKDINLN